MRATAAALCLSILACTGPATTSAPPVTAGAGTPAVASVLGTAPPTGTPPLGVTASPTAATPATSAALAQPTGSTAPSPPTEATGPIGPSVTLPPIATSPATSAPAAASPAAQSPAATARPAPSPSLSLTPAPAPAATAASRCVEDGAELRYPSGGTTVRGALVRPQGNGPFPAALVLHTRGGLNEHALSEASWLASQGFIAYAPDYFTPVGVTPLSFDRQTFTAQYSDAVRDVLAGAISCLRERGDVDRTRVGVVGFSMGGYFAAVLAALDDVNAAAAWYAAYAGSPANNVPAQHSWTDVATAAKRPLLLLHGDADQEVRIDFARRAAAVLQGLGKQSELVVYPGAAHGYDQQGSSRYAYDAAATADSRARTLALLRATR